MEEPKVYTLFRRLEIPEGISKAELDINIARIEGGVSEEGDYILRVRGYSWLIEGSSIDKIIEELKKSAKETEDARPGRFNKVVSPDNYKIEREDKRGEPGKKYFYFGAKPSELVKLDAAVEEMAKLYATNVTKK